MGRGHRDDECKDVIDERIKSLLTIIRVITETHIYRAIENVCVNNYLNQTTNMRTFY